MLDQISILGSLSSGSDDALAMKCLLCWGEWYWKNLLDKAKHSWDVGITHRDCLNESTTYCGHVWTTIVHIDGTGLYLHSESEPVLDQLTWSPRHVFPHDQCHLLRNDLVAQRWPGLWCSAVHALRVWLSRLVCLQLGTHQSRRRGSMLAKCWLHLTMLYFRCIVYF